MPEIPTSHAPADLPPVEAERESGHVIPWDAPVLDSPPAYPPVATTNLPHPDPVALTPDSAGPDPLADLYGPGIIADLIADAVGRAADRATPRRPFREHRAPLTGSVTLDASGDGTVTLGPVPAGEIWFVEHIAVSTSSGGPASLPVSVYDSVPGPINLLDYTTLGARAAGDYPNGLRLYAGANLIVVWDAGTAGDTAHVRAQYTAAKAPVAGVKPCGCD